MISKGEDGILSSHSYTVSWRVPRDSSLKKSDSTRKSASIL